MKSGYKVALFVSMCLTMNASSQNVGIGLSDPTRAKLEVNGAVGITSAIFGGEGAGVSIQRDWPTVGFNQYYNGGNRYIANGFAAAQILDQNGGYLAFDMYPIGTMNSLATTSNRGLVLWNSGNVAIRTIGNNASLWVGRGSGGDGTAVFSGTTFNSHFNFSTTEDTYIRPGKNNGKVIINDVPGGKVTMGNGNGYVGINSGDPQYPLEIRQVDYKGIVLVSPLNNFDYWTINVARPAGLSGSLFFSYNGSSRGGISYVDGQYTALSDARVKNNIKPLPSLLNNVMLLNPVSYEMKNDNPLHESSLGFIAQEVKRLFPELVRVNNISDNGYKITDLHMMNYSGFGVLAIKAIQEQQEIIWQMQKEIEELKMRVRIAEEKNGK